VKSRYEERLREGAAQYLEPGEEVLAVLICQPRGRGQRLASASHLVAARVGAFQERRALSSADEAGLLVSAPMALAVTQRHLLTLKISPPVLGSGGEVQRLLSAVPLSDVDSVEVKRFGLGKRITVVVRKVPVLLEGTVGANDLVAAFTRAKDGA
jgi:hypothetical protein